MYVYKIWGYVPWEGTISYIQHSALLEEEEEQEE